MIRTASFSEDRTMRFDLVRDWRHEVGAPLGTVLFVMLNPSDADDKKDDMTVRKIVGFAKRWGFGRVVAVNLTPTVSTDPMKLPQALPPWDGTCSLNKSTVRRWLWLADRVIAAWGSPPAALCRKIGFSELMYNFRSLVEIDLYCIGTTKCGDPLHPSRTAYTDAPVVWRVRE